MKKKGPILHGASVSAAVGKRLLAEAAKKQPKFGNTSVYIGELRFDSKREADRWGELQLLERSKEISHLARQVYYRLDVNGVHICKYVADFKYFDNKKKYWVIEDAKGFRTREYKIKNKLMRAIHEIEIVEI